MVKQAFTAIATLFILASCSSLKQLNLAPKKAPETQPSRSKSAPKFIDDISMQAESTRTKADPTPVTVINRQKERENIEDKNDGAIQAENFSSVQLKYSVLLNTDVEQLQNLQLLKGVDDWYGTRYRMGGTTKSGVDCSAFVCAIFASVYAITLPRVARDQYKYTRRISRTELQEGDLLFFNTRGGVSHVGIYLQNNKFVHASTSKGVTVSDMFEDYYLKRFIGAGRIENKTFASSN